MTRKRSSLEIYIDVLRTIKGGEKVPTHIMYRTNLSWTPLMRMIGLMINQNLISRVGNDRRKRYIITEKGRETLRYLEEALKLIKIDEGRI